MACIIHLLRSLYINYMQPFHGKCTRGWTQYQRYICTGIKK